MKTVKKNKKKMRKYTQMKKDHKKREFEEQEDSKKIK